MPSLPITAKEEQRFYARNSVKTTLDRAVSTLEAPTSFADECCGMLTRLVAYVSLLALLTIFGLYLWDQLPFGAPPARRPGGLERSDPRTRRWPSTNPIAPTKQRLMKSSRVPRAAARISFAGPSRTKSQSRNARSTGQAANWTCPIPSSNSRP